jgi:hypothetical protein
MLDESCTSVGYSVIGGKALAAANTEVQRRVRDLAPNSLRSLIKSTFIYASS